MPPKKNKASLKGRTSRNVVPQFLKLYQILSDKPNNNAVSKAMKQLGTAYETNDDAIEKNIMVLILSLNGLFQLVNKIDWRQPIQSLNKVLGKLQNSNSLDSGELYFIKNKDKFYKEFVQRIDDFFGGILNSQLPYVEETQIIKYTFQVLSELSSCHFRTVRLISLELAKIMVDKKREYFEQLVSKNSKKKAAKILTIIEDGYIEEIVKFRIKDIDGSIRQKAFELLEQILLKMPLQFIKLNFLNKTFLPLLSENTTEILLKCIKIFKSMLKLKNKNLKVNKDLEIFFRQNLKTLQDISLIPNKSGPQCMKLLLLMKKTYQEVEALKPKNIKKIFQIYGYQKSKEGIKTAISIFYESLCSYEEVEELKNHKQVITTEIIHLLSDFDNQSLVKFILQEFFKFEKEIFSFEDLFILLTSEYYHREKNDIELKMNELQVLLQMIIQLAIFVGKSSKSQWKSKQQEDYNRAILVGSKEIFYDKMTKNQSLKYLYLQLYGQIFFPISGKLENYAQFILNNVLKIIKNEEFDVSGENLHITGEILRNCVKIYNIFNPCKPQLLWDTFKIDKILSNEKYDAIDIIKLSTLTQKYYGNEILNEETLLKTIEAFKHTENKILKQQIIGLIKIFNNQIFDQFLETPKQSIYYLFDAFRNISLQFLINKVLSDEEEDSLIKYISFYVVKTMLINICQNEVQQISCIRYEPDDEKLAILYNYLQSQIPIQQTSNILQITNLMGNQELQIKESLLKMLFQIYRNSFAFLMNKYSINFISTIIMNPSARTMSFMKYINELLHKLIKDQIDHSNRFFFWKFFNQMLSCIEQRNQAQLKNVINYLIAQYFKTRRSTQDMKSLLDKMIMNIVDSIAKIISKKNFQKFETSIYIISKVYRRISKEVLIRLSKHCREKTKDFEEDENVQKLIKYLDKISNVKKGKSKREKKEQEQSSEEGSESADEKKSEENRNESDEEPEPLHEEKDIMEELSSRSLLKTRRQTKRQKA